MFIHFAHLSVPCSVLHNALHSVAAKLMFTKTLALPLDADNSRFEFQLSYILLYDLGQVGNLSEPQLHSKVSITHIWQTVLRIICRDAYSTWSMALGSWGALY